MEYQAMIAGKKKQLAEVLNDETRASEAILDFERECPPGKLRKKLTDWAQFQKKHKVSTVHTKRVGELFWTFVDWSDYYRVRGSSVVQIISSWDAKVVGKPASIEGEGPTRGIWLPQQKQRFRDDVVAKAATR